jgi:DUF4097 and DUF4098 domain-containing protein YvlB
MRLPALRPRSRAAVPALLVPVLTLPLALALAGCDMSLHNLAGRATDEWARTYQLAPGGELHIANTNGRVEIEGVDGSTVEVKAEKVARAATDSGARELLPRIVIREEATSSRVSIETERMNGIMIGAGFEVRYHVRAPKSTVVDVSNTNGAVVLHALTGKVSAHTTNGSVTGKELTGAVDARTTNGVVNVDMASLGKDPITLRTTNGRLTLSLPENAKADLSASWTNGGIDLSNLRMEVSERGRRRFEGHMNGGGTPIELRTTNGGIRVRNRADAAADTADEEQPPARVKERKPSSGERR